MAMAPIHGSDPRLHLSERGEAGVQVVALHWLGRLRRSEDHVLTALRELPIDPRLVESRRPREDQQWSSAVFPLPGEPGRSGPGGPGGPGHSGPGELWAGVAVVALPGHHVAVCEVRMRGTRSELWSALTRLIHRARTATQDVRLPWLLGTGARIGAWLSAAIMVGGLFALGLTRDASMRYVTIAGGLLLLGVIVASLIYAFRYVRRAPVPAHPAHPSTSPAPTPTLPEQAATLWNNPWILAPAAGAIAIATVVGAVIFVPEPNPVTAVAAWVTIVLAAAVLFLGSPHRLLRQVIAAVRRRRQGEPAVQLGQWTEVPLGQVPADVARPPGPLVTAYRHSERGTWATVAAAGAGEDPAWTRWNQLVTEWDSPRGKVSARIYQTWDRQVETIVELATGERSIVLETPRDPATAERLARGLTTKLATLARRERPRSRVTGFLTYSHVPVAALWVSAVLVWVALVSGLGTSLISQGTLRFVALALGVVPPYLLLTSILAIGRPEWFRFRGEHLRRRAYRVLWSALVAAIVAAIPAVAWVERYWTGQAQSIYWWGIALGLLLVLPVVNQGIGRVRHGHPEQSGRGRMGR